MAYVELSKEDWQDVIRAAANKAGSVAGVVNRCGGFTSNEDAPPDAVAEEEVIEEPVVEAPTSFGTYPRDQPESID